MKIKCYRSSFIIRDSIASKIKCIRIDGKAKSKLFYKHPWNVLCIPLQRRIDGKSEIANVSNQKMPLIITDNIASSQQHILQSLK